MVTIKSRVLRILTLFCLAFFVAPSFAASLTATVSSNQVTQAEVFQLRVTYDDKVDSDSIDFKALESEFFMGQPSFGSSLNFINGKRSSSSEWTIALKAKSLGTATIPSFTIDGNRSAPITIQVTQDTDLPAPGDLVELHSQLDKNSLYPNETTQLKTRLVIKADARRLQNVKITPPSAIGFSVQLVGQANQYQTIINGVEATVVDQTFNVKAEQAPKHELKSIGFDATVVFGSNRSGTTKLLPVQIAPESLAITVKSKPTNLGAAWLPTAKLELAQTWLDTQNNPIADLKQQHSLTLGDSLTRELTLTIQGLNPDSFPKLNVTYPSGVRPYIEKPQFKTLNDGSTQMTIRHVLIAQHVGQVELPPITIEWFDTVNEVVKKASVDGLSLDVQAGDTVLSNPVITAPTTPQPVTQISAGFWPYLTALFAALWVATLAWHLHNKRQPKVTMPNVTNLDSTESFLAAIKTNDVARTMHLAKQWLAENRIKDDHLAKQIEDELRQMASQKYRSDSATAQPLWQPEKLLALVKQLKKTSQTVQKTTQLPKL